MRIKTRLFLALATLIALCATPALAAGMSSYTFEHTPAWAISDATLYDGPGGTYAQNGAVIGETQLLVTRCHVRWCHVEADTGSGWLKLDNLSFGQAPRGPFAGRTYDYGSEGGRVCFYTGQDYTGTQVCGPSGTTVRDLKLYGYDNAFRSVEVLGSANVMVCRDFDYGSYCTRITSSKPVLGQFLYQAISSYRVY